MQDDTTRRPPMPLHWSDDPRFESLEHYNDVMAGRATLEPINGTDKDAGPGDIDFDAAQPNRRGLATWGR